MRHKLDAIVHRINRKCVYLGLSCVVLRSGYSKYGVSQESNIAQYAVDRDISPLLTPRALMVWLEAFEEGIDYCSQGCHAAQPTPVPSSAASPSPLPHSEH